MGKCRYQNYDMQSAVHCYGGHVRENMPTFAMLLNVAEILDAIRNDPRVRDALRQELLSQDLLELPERFAEYMASTNARLDGLTEILAQFMASTNQRLELLEEG